MPSTTRTPSPAATLDELCRTLPPGERPRDSRLGPLRRLDSYFPFKPLPGIEAWPERAETLRRRVLVALGLWPLPPRTPLRAEIYAPVQREDYTVWKVRFESLPRHYVTGLLYRPKPDPGKKHPCPGVLCPHGHWQNGRYYDAAALDGAGNVRNQIADGAERFLEGGRNPIQARCVQLARMGCIAFSYDMEGYGDSLQLNHAPGERKEMNAPGDWGYFSPAADLRLQTMMGLQTWNSIRALDFLLELPEIDPQRIAVTGASGGGTQTFILGAVDDRPALLFPAVMVSTAMQGGCTCENAHYLRIDAGNIDIAALAAHPDAFRNGRPRPLGMTAAHDWTLEMPKKGFPDLARLYADLGAPERVALFPFPQFEHNYNAVSRVRMYNFINRWFELGHADPVLERDYQPLTPEEQSVWDARHPKPAGADAGPEHERALLRWWTRRSEEQFQALIPADSTAAAQYRRVIGGAWEIIIGRTWKTAGVAAIRRCGELRIGPIPVLKLVIENTTYHERLPALLLRPPGSPAPAAGIAVALTDSGKSGVFTPDHRPQPRIQALLEQGVAVLAVDMLYQGEFRRRSAPITRQRMVKSIKAPYSAYTFGYNPPLYCRRVHDALTALAAARGLRNDPAAPLQLVAAGAVAGPIGAAALAMSEGNVQTAEIATAGFRFAGIDRHDHPMFVPGAVKYGDLPGLLALFAPRPLHWTGARFDEAALRPLRAMYRALGRSQALQLEEPPDPTPANP